MPLSPTQKKILMVGVPAVAVLGLWAYTHKPASTSAGVIPAGTATGGGSGSAISPGALTSWEASLQAELTAWEQKIQGQLPQTGAAGSGSASSSSGTTGSGDSGSSGSGSGSGSGSSGSGTTGSGSSGSGSTGSGTSGSSTAAPTAPIVGHNGTVAIGTAVAGGAAKYDAQTATIAASEGVPTEVTPTVSAPQYSSAAPTAVGSVTSNGNDYTVYVPNQMETIGQIAQQYYPNASPAVALATLEQYNPQVAGESAGTAAPSAISLPQFAGEPVLNPSAYGA